MQFSIFYVLFVGYALENAEAGGGKKDHVHIKIHVPKIIKHHHHTKYVYIKNGHKKGHDDHGHDDKKKVQVVIHKHEHSHKHDHGHKHGHQHGHKHDAKHDHNHNHKGNIGHKHEVTKVKDHKHNDHGTHQGFSEAPHGYSDYEDHSSYSVDPYSGNFQRTLTGLKSEKYQYETIENPSGEPKDRYIVKGSYRVQEKDPYDLTTKGYQHNFKYPSGKAPSQQDIYRYSQLVNQFKSNNDELFPPYSTSPPTVEDIKQLEEDHDYRREKLQHDYEQSNNKNYVDYDYNPPLESYEKSNYEYDGPSDDQSFKKYRIDGPDFDDH